jgi:hypothetical protein
MGARFPTRLQLVALLHAVARMDADVARELATVAGADVRSLGLGVEGHSGGAPLTDEQRAAIDCAVVLVADVLDIGPTRVRAALAATMAMLFKAQVTVGQAAEALAAPN